MKIGALIIAQDEEENLPGAIRSLSWVDHVLVVDGGSRDRTVEAARDAGAEVLARPFDDFGRQREFAFSRMRSEWVLSLDADEEVTPELAAGIRRVLENPGDVNGYCLRRDNWFCGQRVRHIWSRDWPMRLFRRDAARVAANRVHEGYIVAEPFKRLDQGSILHRPFRSIAQYLAKTEQYTSLGAEELADRKPGIWWPSFLTHPASEFWRNAVAHRGFLDGAAGVVVSMLSALTSLVQYVKSYEFQQNTKCGSQRILLVRPDRIGDVMLASGLPTALKKEHPGLYIGFLVSPQCAPLLAHHPAIDEVLVDVGEAPRDLARKLRVGRFDSAFLLVQSRRHVMATKSAGIPRRYGIGGKPYEWLFGIRGLRRSRRQLRHQNGKDILGLAGLKSGRVMPRIELLEDEQASARAWLRRQGLETGRRACLNPAHSGSSPNWPLENWIGLSRRLCEAGWHVLVNPVGLPQADLRGFQNPVASGRLVVLPDLDLRGLAAAIAECDLLISANTGPLHMAAGVGTPGLGFYCPLPGLDANTWAQPGEIPVLPESCDPCPGPAHCRLAGLSVDQVVGRVESVYAEACTGK